MSVSLRIPFFEIGTKQYIYGDDVLNLAIAADEISKKYDIDIIFTTPFVDIRRVKENTEVLHIVAPHMDAIRPGRGQADILPEAIKSAGATGVLLNHCERPITLSLLSQTIERAKEIDLFTMVCANSIQEIKAVALLQPDIIVAEPIELIGGDKTSSLSYVQKTIEAVHTISDKILIMQGAGISSAKDVYRNIYAGADATGVAAGIVKASNPIKMADEMVCALKMAYFDRLNQVVSSQY